MPAAVFGGELAANPFRPSDPAAGPTPEQRAMLRNRIARDMHAYFTPAVQKLRAKKAARGKPKRPPPPAPPTTFE